MTTFGPLPAVLCALLLTSMACGRGSTSDQPLGGLPEPTASISTLSDLAPPEAVPVRMSDDPDSLWHHITMSIVTDAATYSEDRRVRVSTQLCNTSDEVLTLVSSGGGSSRIDIMSGTRSVANDYDGYAFPAAVSYREMATGCAAEASITWDQLEGPLHEGAGGYEERTALAPRGTYRVVYTSKMTICRGPDPSYREGDFAEGACDDRHPDPVSSNEFELR